MTKKNILVKVEEDEYLEFRKTRKHFGVSYRELMTYGSEYLENLKNQALLDNQVLGYSKAFIQIAAKYCEGSKSLGPSSISLTDFRGEDREEKFTLKCKLLSIDDAHKNRSVAIIYSIEINGKVETYSAQIRKKNVSKEILWLKNQIAKKKE